MDEEEALTTTRTTTASENDEDVLATAATKSFEVEDEVDDDDEIIIAQPRNRCGGSSKACSALMLLAALSAIGYASQKSHIAGLLQRLKGSSSGGCCGDDEAGGIVPNALLELGVYEADRDFVNEAGRIPPFWDGDCSEGARAANNTKQNSTDAVAVTCINRTKSSTTASSSSSSSSFAMWGPCYAPHGNVQWDREAAIEAKSANDKPRYHRTAVRHLDRFDLAGYCKPGFLIIGAGKCGTSSLYHYIVDHPRVLPASEKQIHYFKVRKSRVCCSTIKQTELCCGGRIYN